MIKNLVILLSFISYSYLASAQDCALYIPVDEGASWEMTSYNAKGKEGGKIYYELVEKSAQGDDITFTIKSRFEDGKGKETFESTYEAYCHDGVFEIDMQSKMDGVAMGAYKDMKMEVDATNYEVPDMDASPGTKLDDASLEVQVAGIFNMIINTTDREVLAREEIETPAGTFDCLVLTQTTQSKMIVKVQSTTKEWYAPGVGLVRSESYNKKGKLTGYSELTALNQ